MDDASRGIALIRAVSGFPHAFMFAVVIDAFEISILWSCVAQVHETILSALHVILARACDNIAICNRSISDLLSGL